MGENRPTSEKGHRVWKLIMGLLWPVLILGALITAGLLLPAREWITATLEWSRQAGFWGMLVVWAGYMVTCVLMLPTSLFTFGAGFLYGFWVGALVAVGGSTLGATVAYGLARGALGRWFLKHAENFRSIAIVRSAAEEGHLKLLLLTRMSPITPFAFLNYLYGALGVRPWRFVWTTAAGMLPGTLLCVFIGTGLRSLSGVGQEDQGATWPFWAGLAASVVAVVFIGFYARAALKNAARRVDDKDDEAENEETSE